jgi:hypothetical protein
MTPADPLDPHAKNGGHDRALPEMEARHGRPNPPSHEAKQSEDYSRLEAFQPAVGHQVPAIYLIEREAIRLRRQRRQEVSSAIPQAAVAPLSGTQPSEFQGVESNAPPESTAPPPPLEMYARPADRAAASSAPTSLRSRIRRMFRRSKSTPS